MPDLWLPGALRVPGNNGLIAGAGGGKGKRFHTWHSFEAPYTFSPDCLAAARYLNTQSSTATFCFHPTTGAIAQLLPANQAARTLRVNDGTKFADVNRYGDVHMQTEVIAFAKRPFTLDLTEDGRRGLEKLVNFLRSWGIPDQWAWAGQAPPAYPGGSVRRRWPDQSGHAYHSGWPVNDHGDPGAIAAPWTVLGGTVMARPNHATMLKVEAELRSRGLSIYCGPSDWAAGRCAPGKHGHSSDSRHFKGLAVDFGYGAAPINDTEALLVELIMGVYLPRWFPGVDFRKLWNVGPGNHEDHGHLDDMAGLWTSVVRPRGNVRSRDGVDLFVPVRVIPEHVPPINHGLTLAHVAKVQGLLGLHADGYHGTNTTRAVRNAQNRLGILVDGKGGPATLAALLEDAKPKPKPPKPKPPVVVEPEPEPVPDPDPDTLAARVAPFRIAGPDAYATAVTATEWEAPDGPGLILYARDTTDATTAAILAARAGVDALPVPTSHGLPLPVRDRIAELDLGWLFVVGGPASVLDTTVADALTAAGITH